MKIAVPEFSMVLMIGTTGSGKSSLAARLFPPTQVLSSDTMRGWVGDDELDQAMTTPAFEVLHFLLNKRLELGRLTVVDATNLQAGARKSLLDIAGKWHALKVAIVMDTPEAICEARNAERGDRAFPPHVLINQRREFRRMVGGLKKEGFHRIYFVKPEDAGHCELVLDRVWSRRPEEKGPFDIVGDIHGCLVELEELISKLGYRSAETGWSHPEGRRLFFVGDLVDRGPNSVEVVRRVMKAVESGTALMVPGNHDVKLARALRGGKVSLNHGLDVTLAQFQAEPKEFQEAAAAFLQGLVSHAVLDGGRLCVAHAGMRAEMQGRGSAAVREFALYGETTGEIDEFGLPVRYPWALDYRGQALVVYGHTPVPEAEFLNNTIDIDTGCCFGGKLTALRYPERELVSVPARQVYAEPIRPIEAPRLAPVDDLLDIVDVLGRRGIESRLAGRKTIREENAAAALEIMSRFAADPRWLIYLPPTMSPSESSSRDGYLEYPTESLDYFRQQGVTQVIAQEKHMGSRAVAIVCQSAETAARRFGVDSGETGAILTRTGRRFFDDLAVESALLGRLARAAESSGLFTDLNSDWILLDLELMPWSAKAQGLLQDHYAPVAAAGLAHADALMGVISGLEARGQLTDDLRIMAGQKHEAAHKFRDAYRRYCWPVHTLEDYKLAPFHLLASESGVHTDQSHPWHMAQIGRLCAAEPGLLKVTQTRSANLDSEDECAALCAWWEELVSSGGEGAVIKPVDFIARGPRGLVQPALKCRGPEYLRIIYGPEYQRPDQLVALRRRNVNRKRGLASAEFALGIESLERFLRGEGMRRVHECVFGILALESEPVDPRL